MFPANIGLPAVAGVLAALGVVLLILGFCVMWWQAPTWQAPTDSPGALRDATDSEQQTVISRVTPPAAEKQIDERVAPQIPAEAHDDGAIKQNEDTAEQRRGPLRWAWIMQIAADPIGRRTQSIALICAAVLVGIACITYIADTVGRDRTVEIRQDQLARERLEEKRARDSEQLEEKAARDREELEEKLARDRENSQREIAAEQSAQEAYDAAVAHNRRVRAREQQLEGGR